MLPFHPYADLFPMIEGKEFVELVADIKANDIHDKIVVWDGAILDGRNRYKAGLEAGLIDPDDGPDRAKYFTRFVPAVDGDPLKFVMSKNLNRRHMDESQRAMVAARYATMRQGRPESEPEKPANLPVKQVDAARTLSISERALRHARRVQDHGTPELVRAVDRGRLAVSVAEKASRLAPAVQRRIAAEAEAGNIGVARGMVKKEVRSEREADLADKQRALPTEKSGLIYCDIPRHFHVHSDETGMDRAPENHYPTMTFQQLLDLPVGEMATEDCILVYWSTAASLIDDIEIMAEWGFVTLRPRDGGKLRRDLLKDGEWVVGDLPGNGQQSYRSMQVWDKIRIGLGYWFRDRHEFILIGVRGNPVPPAPGTQDHSLFSEERTEHSAKPDRVAEMLHRLWPNTPTIELFARKARPEWSNWKVWGKEAPTTEIIERTEASPNSEPSSPVAPQSEAGHADTGSETSAGCEAVTAGEGANALATISCIDVDRPVADDPLDALPFLRRNPDNSFVASRVPTQLADAGEGG